MDPVVVLALTIVLSVLSGVIAGIVVARWPGADLAATRMTSRYLAGRLRRHPRLAALLARRTDAVGTKAADAKAVDPKTAASVALTAAALIVIVGLAAFGLLLFMVRTRTGFAWFDQSAARFGAQHATKLSTNVLRAVTQLGGALVLVPLAVVVAVLEARHQSPGPLLGFLTLTVGGQFLIVDIIKWIVDRARPNLSRLTGFSGQSFPSGHAAAAAACLAAFALVIGRHRSVPTRSILGAWAVGLAVAISCSRVFLGVHWLTDVLAGLAIGWAWFAICQIAFGGRILLFAAPVEAADPSSPPQQVLNPK